MSDLAYIWLRLVSNEKNLGLLGSFSDHFGLVSKKKKQQQKMTLNSLRFVTFSTNLAQLEAKSNIPDVQSEAIPAFLFWPPISAYQIQHSTRFKPFEFIN